MNIYYDSLVFLAFFSLALCILAWLLKSPLRSFIMQVSEFWRKAGWMTRAGALTVFFALWIYASVKPTNQTQSASTPLSQQIELIMSGTASTQSGIDLVPPETVTSNTVPELTAAQAAAGFCILSVETNLNPAVCWSTNDLPSGTAVHVQDDWLATGRYNDGFWLNTANLGPLCAFRLNSQDVTNIYISTSGTVSFGVPKGAEAAQPMPTSSGISFLSPLWGPIGIKPGPDGSSVWVASTTNHNILVTWEDILIDRIDSSNTVGSIQCELCNNGDFIYRYSVSPALTLSNHVVGAQNNGFGESADLLNATNSALCVNAFEVKWAGYFQSYEMDESGDTDGDGLLDKEEVRIHGTYPAREDSDGDLWSDSYELTNSVFSTDPLNPDSDGDTIIDSLDSDPLTWEDVTAINTNDGYTTQYHADNGLPHAYDLSTDSDNDGVPDWIELLCGSSETNAGSRCYSGEDYFEVSITLAADLPAPVILKIGSRTLCLRYAGTRSLIFAAGQAHAVTLLACERCLVNLGISFSTGKAVLLNPSAVFSGGAVLPAGAEQAGGTIALARVNVDPGLICFHSSGSKTAIGSPVPDMPGTYTWSWFEEAGESVTLTGKTVNISWQGGGSSRSLNLVFRPDGATEDIYGHKTVYRCTLTEDNPGGDAADWIGPDDPPEPPCAWPQSPEETEDHPSTNNAAGPGEPFYAARYGIAIAVNNDDDDADGKLDNDSTEDGVSGDDDLYVSYLYTPFTGGCCPCPSHNPAVSSVSIEYISSKLRLWDDAQKTTASTGVNAGQLQYLEGVSPSTSVTGEPLILSWTEDDEYKAKTNNYTVFSLRMFGDYNLDGAISSNDYAAASDISDNGWVMPVASNTLRRLELKNDVLIPGIKTLYLSGSSGIRIWDTPNPASTNTPLLVAGQTITNGVDGTDFGAYPDGMLYVEATDAGTATLCYSYQGTGDAEDFGCVTLLSIRGIQIELCSVQLDTNGYPVVQNGNVVPSAVIGWDDVNLSTYVASTGRGTPQMEKTINSCDNIITFEQSTGSALLSITSDSLETVKEWDLDFQVSVEDTDYYVLSNNDCYVSAEFTTSTNMTYPSLALEIIDEDFTGSTNTVVVTNSLCESENRSGYYSNYTIENPREDIGYPAYSGHNAFVVRMESLGLSVDDLDCYIEADGQEPVDLPFTDDGNGHFVSCLVVPVHELDGSVDLGLEITVPVVKMVIEGGAGWSRDKIEIGSKINSTRKKILRNDTFTLKTSMLLSSLVSLEDDNNGVARARYAVVEAGKTAIDKLKYGVTPLFSPDKEQLVDMLKRHSVWVHSGHAYNSQSGGIMISEEDDGEYYKTFFGSSDVPAGLEYDLVFMNTCSSTDELWLPNNYTTYSVGGWTNVEMSCTAVMDIGTALNAKNYIGWDCRVKRTLSMKIPKMLMEELNTAEDGSLRTVEEAVDEIKEKLQKNMPEYYWYGQRLNHRVKDDSLILDLNRKCL